MLSKRARPYDPKCISKRARLRRNVEDIFASGQAIYNIPIAIFDEAQHCIAILRFSEFISYAQSAFLEDPEDNERVEDEI